MNNALLKIVEAIKSLKSSIDSISISSGTSSPVQNDTCRLFKSAAQSTSDSTYTKVTFDSENIDTNDLHNNITNNTRITAQQAGKYIVGGALSFNTNSTGMRYSLITVNNSESTPQTTKTKTINRLPAVSGFRTEVNLSTVVDLAIGDYVEIWVYQNSGSAIDIKEGEHVSNFWAIYIGE